MAKKPKAPKENASLKVWENYDRKLSDYAKKQAIIKRVRTKANKL